MVPNTACCAGQLPTKAVFASNKRRKGVRRGVKNTCCSCFVNTAPALTHCQIPASALQMNKFIQILVRTICIDPLFERLILANALSVFILLKIFHTYR